MGLISFIYLFQLFFLIACLIVVFDSDPTYLLVPLHEWLQSRIELTRMCAV